MTTHRITGHTDVYEIGEGPATSLRRWRLRRAGHDVPRTRRRRTRDRWHRRWQAEHTGDMAHLGATRRWTRTGAFIAHESKVQHALDPTTRRTAWRQLTTRTR